MADGRFQKGNQLAKGNPLSGRPSLYSLDDIEEMGNKLIEWVQNPGSFILLEFCVINKFSAQYLSKWENMSPVFKEALWFAKTTIAERREKLDHYGKLNHGTFNRYQGMYDTTLTEHERGEKEFEYRLRANLEQKNNAQIIIQTINYADANDGN